MKKIKIQLFARLKKGTFFMIGFTICILIVILSVIALFIKVHDPNMIDLDKILMPPQYFSKGWSGHVLGTDSSGRDVLTRLLIGSRYSLIVAIEGVFFGILVGIIIGLYSGYYGGWIDNLFMRFADIQLSIPPLLLAIAVVSVLGPSMTNLVIVLIITWWPQNARVVRGSVLTIREMEFISASRALGGSDSWIMFFQILPNITTPILILASQQMGVMILTEAALSFLGLGIQPPNPSWGVMIAEGREYLIAAPWVVMSPGIALMITILAFNFLGDGLRDLLEPKMLT